MEQKMFCFQCEQTAGCSGCTGNAGVCGKSANTAKLQDELTGALIGLAKSCGNNPKTENTDRIIIEGLFTTITNVNFNDETLKEMIAKVKAEKNKIVPDCSACQNPCGNTDDYDMNNLWNDNEDIRSLKSLILFGIRGMAAYAYHAMVLGYTSDEVKHLRIRNHLCRKYTVCIAWFYRHQTVCCIKDWCRKMIKFLLLVLPCSSKISF